MKIGLIGLGRMGELVAKRLLQAHHTVIGYDPIKKLAPSAQFSQVATLQEIAQQTEIIWIMVPAGKPVDDVIATLLPHLQPHAILIDGGNSHFTDSIRRAEQLKQRKFHLLDCGSSGGIRAEQGLSLMIGGEQEIFERAAPVFQAIAAPQGYAHVGPSGAGHYVKMVHNGIEYALLEGYAEGFHLLRNGHYKELDLATISEIWCHGAIIRSWLLEVAHEIFKKDQYLHNVPGKIAENGTGRWTAQEADQQKIPMPALEAALRVRQQSQTSVNFATKLIALLRHAFGGHPFQK